MGTERQGETERREKRERKTGEERERDRCRLYEVERYTG